MRTALTAYQLYESPIRIEPAPAARDWMDATRNRFAYWCLPLAIANQAGWILTCGRDVTATWDGGAEAAGITLDVSGDGPVVVDSHFGYGIISWQIPFLFRTSPGYNLLVRGIPNAWKDGATPLEALIEADWSVASFTMNWRMTVPGRPVHFAAGEPLCLVLPQRRGELEDVETRLVPLSSDPALEAEHHAWASSRNAFVANLREDAGDPPSDRWQKHYMRGTSPGGASAREHQTRLRLRPFESA